MTSTLQQYDLTIDFDGRSYRAHYTLESGVIIVQWKDKHSRRWERSISASSDFPQDARMLFRQILTDAKARGAI